MSLKSETQSRQRQMIAMSLPGATSEQLDSLMEVCVEAGIALRGACSPTDRESSSSRAVNHHRIEVTFTGGIHNTILFKGVCDAALGADCRMRCEVDSCSDGTQAGHESHALLDQGECGVITYLNGDPSLIPELYDGLETQLRPGFIECSWDCDGVTWSYDEASPSLSRDELLWWVNIGPTEAREESGS